VLAETKSDGHADGRELVWLQVYQNDRGFSVSILPKEVLGIGEQRNRKLA